MNIIQIDKQIEYHFNEIKKLNNEKSMIKYPATQIIRKAIGRNSIEAKIVNALEKYAIKRGYKGYHNY